MKRKLLNILCLSAMAISLACCTYFDEHYRGALAGNADDQYAIATCYDDGDGGVPGGRKDKTKAAEWYRKAAEQGHAKAQNNLGVLYEEGLGVPQSDEDAFAWFSKSAQQGYRYGQYNLGRMIKKMVEYWCGEKSVAAEDLPQFVSLAETCIMWLNRAKAQGHNVENELNYFRELAGALRGRGYQLNLYCR